MTIMEAVDPAEAMVLRSRCAGLLPLSGRLEPWMVELLESPQPFDWVQRYGSPVNVIATEPMAVNIGELVDVASRRDIDFHPFFARKANKCLSFVDQANAVGCGIDTASENEVRQCLDRGVAAKQTICTAAVKSDALIRLCVQRDVCVAVDNYDELRLVHETAQEFNGTASIAIRLGGFRHENQRLHTRFGFDVTADRTLIGDLGHLNIRVDGIHFHLDGYDADQRVSAILQSLDWVAELRGAGHDPMFLDIGGGFPVCYLESQTQWQEFWQAHTASLLERRDTITYRRHGLGLIAHEGQIIGRPNVYPYHQPVTRAHWFANVLDTKVENLSIAERLRRANVQLRCEPGRSLLDGCGMTIARVEFKKQNNEADWLIGLSMNRTQCRTTTDDFLVDPMVLSKSSGSNEAMHGYLVGAYCTESELISLRKLSFPRGIARGDLVVFPNTAGYLMHFLESRSHQFELAKNVRWTDSDGVLDPIDASAGSRWSSATNAPNSGERYQGKTPGFGEATPS